MCGESWHAIKGSLTHRPSSQGWTPGVLPLCVCVCVCLVVCLVFCIWVEGLCGWFGEINGGGGGGGGGGSGFTRRIAA